MNKRLAEKIIEMAEMDQKARFKALDAGTTSDISNFVVYAIDNGHNHLLWKIIQDYGYPIKELIGKKALFSFWLLVQHQDRDLKLQKECLENCNFGPKEKAYLTDRVLVNQGKKQIYGTQFNKPIEDIKNVNNRRKKIGLETLEKYLKRRDKIFEKSKNKIK